MPSNSSPAFLGFPPATKQFLPLAYSRHMAVWNWPVLPVMPWVMTRVFLSTRMDMSVGFRSGGGGGGGGGDGLVGRIPHVIRADDGQPRLREDCAAEVFVRALHAHDER